MRNYLAGLMVLVMMVGVVEGQVEWGQFRGIGGAGIAAEGQKLPVEFDKETNVIWRREVPKGVSSPCIWGDRIFLTSFAARKLETICIDRQTGKILWQHEAPAKQVERVHPVSSPAAPTAVTDGKHIMVYFGSYGLQCYDFAGKLLWKREMPLPANMYGTSASPILAGGKLIIMDDPGEDTIVLALDPATGRELWKMDKPGFKAGWSTPVYRKAGDVEEVIIYGKWRVAAFDVKDGKELWTVPGMTDEPCITPVMGEGLVYVSSYNMRDNPEVIGLPTWSELIRDLDKDKSGEISMEESRANKSILSRFDSDGEGDHPLWGMIRMYRLDEDQSGGITEKEWGKMVAFIESLDFANALMAIKPVGKGQDKPEVAWLHSFGVPECPSPLYYDGRVYMVKSGGIATCLDAKTGEKKYQEMLDSGGPYYSSPVVGDGKIYVGSTRGVVTVFELGDELKVLARNNLRERIMATPAIVDNKIYVRTEKALWAFGGK
ncbi:MAG: PQQ-binding-like beta-propeller repeat protein [Planctomycetes bacterium]|nr:PQQ-binding-like beta-propeller repeat protein [Planctomycetota bacterium]